MAAQGNLLAYDLSKLHIYCNTLQAIALGYLIAAVVMLNLRIVGQVLATAALLLAFWLIMMYVPIPGHDAGLLQPDLNLALYIDKKILGPFHDGLTYTWILSSLSFGATVLLGVFAGEWLRWKAGPWTKVFGLVVAGLGCLGLGWAWGLYFPIIKHLYTSSMVLWAAGWSFLLLAFFYAVMDVLGFRRWAFFFVVIGSNAIAVYMATHLFEFRQIGDIFVGNLAPYLGTYGDLVRNIAALAIVWLILLYMYRKRTFLRV